VRPVNPNPRFGASTDEWLVMLFLLLGLVGYGVLGFRKWRGRRKQ
jgi:hypothetical protein